MEDRFKASVRVHVRDKLFGNAIVVNASWDGKTADGLLKKAEEEFAKYLGMMNTEINDKELYNHSKYLLESEGWKIRKLKNHFAKFDIDIEKHLNPQKKLIEG